MNEPLAGSELLEIRTSQNLQDIIEFGELAANLVGRTRAAYDADRMLRLAAEAVTARIGEAVARLPATFIERHPTVPFRQAKAMRNLLSHHYRRIDPAVVWAALETDIPAFCRQVSAMIERTKQGDQRQVGVLA